MTVLYWILEALAPGVFKALPPRYARGLAFVELLWPVLRMQRRPWLAFPFEMPTPQRLGLLPTRYSSECRCRVNSAVIFAQGIADDGIHLSGATIDTSSENPQDFYWLPQALGDIKTVLKVCKPFKSE